MKDIEKETKAEVWGRLADFSQDLLCTTDSSGRFVHMNAACESILGYTKEELIGLHYAGLLLPEDRTIADSAVRSMMSSPKLTSFENRLVHRDRHTVHMMWSSTWSEEDGLIYAIGRDITEMKVARLRLQESEQRYRSLFEQNPDLIFLEGCDGLVTGVNKCFTSTLGIAGEEAVGKNATSFLPGEMALVTERSLQAALSGETLRYDMEMVTAGKERRIFDTIKQPVKMDGQVIGVQTIAKDITPMVRAYETIQTQAGKLETVFESITDAFFTLDRNWKLTYVNGEFDRLLGTDRHENRGKSVWEVFPEEVGGLFYRQYHHAALTGEAVHFEAYLAAADRWLEVKAYPSSEGLSVYFTDITEKVAYRQELERLSLVASHTTNGVIISDSEGRIEWVNAGFTRLTGYSLGEAAGKPPRELLHGDRTDHAAVEAGYRKLKQGEPAQLEVLNTRKDGTDLWVSVQLNPILGKNGNTVRYIAVQTDITERIRTQQELERLSLVASKANNGVIIAGRDWNIEWVNAGFTRLTGYSLEEALDRQPSELLRSSDASRKAFAALESRLLSGEPISFEVLNLRKSGEQVWLSVEINAIFDEGGRLTGYIEIQTDITALKQSELELTELAKDLYRQNRDLQQFTYIVSHNLRAPVANIQGLVEVMASTPKESDEFGTFLSYLGESVLRLDTVLRDVNTILSIRQGRESLQREEVDLHLVLEQAISAFQQQLGEIGGQVVNRVAEGTFVRANRAYLYSILHNLISNAIKYRREDTPLRVRITSYPDAGQGVFLSLSDNGSGFDREKARNDVFKLYKRFHSGKEGRGMGLFLVKNQVEAMDGHIEVSSKEGIGTRFLIYLPKGTYTDPKKA